MVATGRRRYDIAWSHARVVRLALVLIGCVGIVVGGSTGCGDSKPQPPTTASPPPSGARSPLPATNGPNAVFTVSAERPVAVDEEALARHSVLVYSTPRKDGGIDFYTYSRDSKAIVAAFGLPVDVRAGTPELRGRTLVVPVDRSVVVFDLQGNVIEAVATLTADETVVGLVLSADETMLAIGILSRVMTESRLVVVELSTRREFLRVTQAEFAALTTVGAPAPTSWFADDSGIELRAEVGQGATAIPGVSADLTGRLIAREGGPRRISEDGESALSRSGGTVGACDGPSLASRAVRVEDARDDTLIVELSQPNAVVGASFIAPHGRAVVYSTSPLRGDCWDNLAGETWYLWDGNTNSPVNDPEATLRTWHQANLVELDCNGARSAWPFVRNKADLRCPDDGVGELWLDGERVDRVTVAGIVGFAE